MVIEKIEDESNIMEFVKERSPPSNPNSLETLEKTQKPGFFKKPGFLRASDRSPILPKNQRWMP